MNGTIQYNPVPRGSSAIAANSASPRSGSGSARTDSSLRLGMALGNTT